MTAFVPQHRSSGPSTTSCAVVTSETAPAHNDLCPCLICFRTANRRRQTTRLFADVVEETPAETEEEVPSEVEALDGIESSEEAHNADRPARKSLRKKGPRGKPISEFNVGDTVKAKVKAIASYGAFLDIGATTDGLLHISQLSVDYVSDVSSVLEAGQEVDVRIIKIDANKGQVALSLLTEEQEESAKEAANRSRESRDRPQRSSNRRDDSAVLAQLAEKGWNSEQFVEGTVVSTVDFGAFVRIEASQLQEDVTGEFDGLVHISALTAGRASSVESVVSVDDKVQVRVKAIADRKVSLTMVSPEEEAAKMEAMGAVAASEGAKDWKESLEKIRNSMPAFKNGPVVVDTRK